MILVKPSFSIMAASGHPELPYNYNDPLPLIEAAGRTCYKSEDGAWGKCPKCGGEGLALGKVGRFDALVACPICDSGRFPTSACKFVDMLERRNHVAMIEHGGWIPRMIGYKEYLGLSQEARRLLVVEEDSVVKEDSFSTSERWMFPVAGNYLTLKRAGLLDHCAVDWEGGGPRVHAGHDGQGGL